MAIDKQWQYISNREWDQQRERDVTLPFSFVRNVATFQQRKWKWWSKWGEDKQAADQTAELDILIDK